MKRFLAILMLSLTPLWGNGAIVFDGDDYYDCGNSIDIDTSKDDASFLAWITPNFASTDTTTQVIFSNANLQTCPTLPPFCTGVTCGEGFALFWDGGNTEFVCLGRGVRALRDRDQYVPALPDAKPGLLRRGPDRDLRQLP